MHSCLAVSTSDRPERRPVTSFAGLTSYHTYRGGGGYGGQTYVWNTYGLPFGLTDGDRLISVIASAPLRAAALSRREAGMEPSVLAAPSVVRAMERAASAVVSRVGDRAVFSVPDRVCSRLTAAASSRRARRSLARSFSHSVTC